MLATIIAFSMLACGPGDPDILLENDFESVGALSEYNIVDNELDNTAEQTWKIGSLNGYEGNAAYVGIDKALDGFVSDSRMELITLDLTERTWVEFSFDYTASYLYAISSQNDGGPNVKEGGYDLKVCVSVNGGEWETVWHEADDPNFTGKDEDQWYSTTVDLSDYASKANVKLAVWVIGKDGDVGGVDNIKVSAR